VRTLEVIALVYRSVVYARFITDQLVRYSDAKGWQVTARVVANDPEVEDALLLAAPREAGLRTDVYRDRVPGDYYLNRVYRCWNWVTRTSVADHVCLVNSDMAFSPGWLEALLRHHDGRTTPTSRLVESGKMPSGRHAISQNLGRCPRTFREEAWLRLASELREDEVERGGLFMPVVFERQEFARTGGYPEGNVYRDGVGTRNGPVVQSGDAFFFERLQSLGRPHVTVFDSLVYHFQEGEKDASREGT
jgi:hypothetical protein